MHVLACNYGIGPLRVLQGGWGPCGLNRVQVSRDVRYGKGFRGSVAFSVV